MWFVTPDDVKLITIDAAVGDGRLLNRSFHNQNCQLKLTFLIYIDRFYDVEKNHRISPRYIADYNYYKKIKTFQTLH